MKRLIYSNHMLKKLLIFLVFIFSFLVFVSPMYASTLNLTPSSANIPQGSTLSVQVRLNTQGEGINGVSSYLSYPKDKLDVVSISYGSSAFTIQAEHSYGGGGIRISRGSITGVSGNVKVATIGLKGKSQGTATVSFVNGSAAPRTSDSSDSLNLSGSSGGTYTITPPQVSSQSAEQDKTPPVITNIKVSDISTDSATITWTTDKESDSGVEYGLQEDRYILQAYDKTLTTEHKIVLSGNLIPGETFHFRVKSKGSVENEAVSNNLTFKLKGYTIRITVLDSNSNPVPNAEVILYSTPLSGVTDQNGEVTFADVSLGSHLVVVKLKDGTELTREINVLEDRTLSEFTLTLNIPSGSNKVLLAIFYSSLAILISIAVVGVIILRRKGNTPANTQPEPPNPPPMLL